MVDLNHTLQGSDLNFLRMIANAWGIELTAPDAHSALPILVKSILDSQLIQEIVDSLSEEAKKALKELIHHQGQIPWSIFTRKFGEVRMMGAAKRDRERPDLSPVSVTEILWYRALIGRAFLNISSEPQEYAYIPDEFLDQLSSWGTDTHTTLGRPASPKEKNNPIIVTDQILDHLCTFLAALRSGIIFETPGYYRWKHAQPFLRQLCLSMGLINPQGNPLPDAVRAFLETPRSEALANLVSDWMESQTINELAITPGLRLEGNIMNDPLRTRKNVLDLLSEIPQDTWWNLRTFISAVKTHHPDFQRTAGDYDAWHIFSIEKNVFLRGFTSWEDVEGALLRFLISGPLHWLGLVDIATDPTSEEITAFRLSAWSKDLWHGHPPEGFEKEDEPVRAFSDGRIICSNLTPRAVRYQISRFVEWEDEGEKEYRYRVTGKSIKHAYSQGLRPSHLLAILKRSAAKPVPPSLLKALEHWEKNGCEVEIQRAIVLKANPETITALRKSAANRFLGENLNPNLVVIKAGGIDTVRDTLTGLGLFADIHDDS